jgi:peptidase E
MKGSIIFNGNIRLETDFIQTFQDRILASNHSDPVVRDSKKVLLVTAAWQKREFYESHVKEALYDIGLDPAFDGSYDQNIQNLSVYHDFNTFKTHEPELYAAYHTKQEVIQQVKIFYREKNSGLIGILQRQLRNLKATFRGATLYKALTYNVAEASRQLEALGPWDLLFHYACQDIQASMASIRANDAQMLQVCKEIDDHFFATSGIQQNVRYQTMKKALEDRILSSNSIFIFGGHIAVLFNRLNFFKLKEAFVEALHRGTNFYTVSAGSLSLCEYLIVFDDNSTEWTGSSRMYDFEFFDQGFGIVSKVQMFPHCKDYIHMEDPDTVTYLAARFNLNLPVGLDEHSFLLMDTYTHKDKEYERFVSVGDDEGLYLFDLTGQVKVKRYGEELVLPGTRFYSPLAE